MSELGERMPVERLSDRSRARIERGVFEALDREPMLEAAAPAPAARRVRGSWFMLAGATAAAAAVALVVLWPRATHAPKAAAPVRVVADDAARTVVLDGVTIDMALGAALVASGDVVVLERGHASFEVARRGSRPAFVVQAGEVRVEVIGTRFAVERHEDSASVTVEEGTVRVLTPSTTTLVTTGESWPAAAAAADPDPAAEIVIADDPPPPRRPHAAKSPTPSAPATPADIADARAQYERAASLEARDPAAALAGYRKVAAGDGPWAATALFAAARLELDLGHAAEGRRLLGDYLGRFPSGANADDARLLLR